MNESPLSDPDFRAYAWQMMLDAVGTHEPPPELDRMGRAKEHGQKAVIVKNNRFNAGNHNPVANMHPFKNYHFTRHLD